MGHVMHGVKEVYTAPGSAAFPADDTGVHGLGLDGKGSLIISDFNPIKGDKGRNFITYKNHKIERKTNQFQVALLKALLGYAKASDVSTKVATSGVTKVTNFTSAAGGIFTYENAKSLGIDLEIELSNTEAAIKVIMEKAFTKASSLEITTASKTATVVGALNMPMLDSTGLIVGAITPDFGTVDIGEDRLSTFRVFMKTVGTKNGMNKSLCARMAVTIEGVMSGPDVDEIEDILDFEVAPDVTIAVPVATPYDIILKAGGLTKSGEVVIDDDKREGKIVLTGEYDFDFMDLTGDDITFNANL